MGCQFSLFSGVKIVKQFLPTENYEHDIMRG